MQKTLTELLVERSELDNKGITFIEGKGKKDFLSYKELYQSAVKVLAYLQSLGIGSDNELVIQLDDNKLFLQTFWGCILGGIKPVPLSVGRSEEHKKKIAQIWPILNQPHLITNDDNAVRQNISGMRSRSHNVFEDIKKKIVEIAEIPAFNASPQLFKAKEDDIAFIQFSSGSTGLPKGVILTHKNIIKNISAIGTAANYATGDSTLSWMPLTHDMGMIGFHINPLFVGMDQCLIPTSLFIKRPSLWMDTAHELKSTILCSPNFGYRYFLKYYNLDSPWDLSNIRIIYNGAEPIFKNLCDEFSSSLSVYGLRKNAIRPVYGLAEGSLAVSISNLNDEVLFINSDRGAFLPGRKVVPVHDDTNTVSIVNVGQCINNCFLRVADDDDVIVGDSSIGHIQIKGDSVTSGYYNNSEGTKNLFSKDGWLRTGDLGFLRDQSLYITGRVKDVLFVNGQNFYSHDLERAAQEVEGIELNKIVFAGYSEADSEKIVAFVFFRGKLESFISLAEELRGHINKNFGFTINKVLPVKDIPRTTSGKLQRFRLLELLREGAFANIETELNALTKGSSRIIESPAGDEFEEKIHVIFKEVLSKHNIDLTDRFFEIGGNSLKAGEVIMRILKEFHVELSFRQLFENQSIFDLAEIVRGTNKTSYSALPEVEETEFYSLSSTQKRIFYSSIATDQSIAYNMPVAFEIIGEIDFFKLQDCIQEIISRHESLRTTFHNSTNPVFKINSYVPVPVCHIECAENEIENRIQELIVPYNLSSFPLFKIALIKAKPLKTILFLDFHHIISDGVSVFNFLDELLNLYAGVKLLDLPVQFKRYSMREKQLLFDKQVHVNEKYWASNLAELPTLQLPLDFPRPAIFDSSGSKVGGRLSGEMLDALKSFSKENNCSIHSLLFAIYTILLHKYTAQEDIVIGIPVANRRHPDILKTLGAFVNNLPIRSKLNVNQSFSKFALHTQENITTALAHQDITFEAIIDLAGSIRDISRNPVFDSMFNYQNMGIPFVPEAGFRLEPLFLRPAFSKFDLSLEISDYDTEILYAFEYSSQLFRKSTIEGIQKSFLNLVTNLLTSPASLIKELSVLDKKKFESVVYHSNSTLAAYTDSTVHGLFENQVLNAPDNVALEYNNEIITYKELDDKANDFAEFLQNSGVGNNDVVPVLLPRSPQFIISILGILKVGASYLPVDTDLPDDRIKFIVKDSRAKILVTDSRANGFDIPVVNITTSNKHGVTQAKIKEPLDAGNSINLAYIIYTSGTTGAPKGVMVKHKSLINYVTWASKTYAQDRNLAFALFTSLSFDLTITSIFLPLLTGNKLVIYNSDGDDLLLEKVLKENKVDILKLTPSHLKLLVSNSNKSYTTGSRIKTLIVGGEQLETQLAKDVVSNFGGQIEIFNEYGPTEATVGCMIYKYSPNDNLGSVPIGVAAANTKLYLLDKYLKPVPDGVEAELYISGDCLAEGYLYNENLSVQKFISNPFISDSKMYKTGDIVKRLSDGRIIYIGRSDNQVKINGYRVEVEEITNQLKQHSAIADAWVFLKDNKLLAYYQLQQRATANEGVLKEYLAKKLPYYMVPVHFIPISTVPLTNNGKVDFNLFPSLDSVLPKYNIAESPVQVTLLKIFKEVLSDDTISVSDNFFEKGGDSIKAIQIISKLKEVGVDLLVRDILSYHTIELISRQIKSTDRKVYEQTNVQGDKKLIPIESWFFSRGFKNPNFYNQSVLLKFNRIINKDVLKQSFTILINHHDGLRLNYDPDRNLLFFNPKNINKEILIEKYTADANLKEVFEKVKGSFDISSSLLIKPVIIEKNDQSGDLFITAHHLVIDGVSWRILLEDLYSIYTALEAGTNVDLPAKTASLADWANNVNATKVPYENNSITEVDFSIPLITPSGGWKTKDLKKFSLLLSRPHTLFLLKDAHYTYKTDVPILLNAALALTIKEWTQCDKMVVEQEGHGRYSDSVDVSRTIGWFTVMDLVEIHLPDDSLSVQIKAVKEQLRKVSAYGLPVTRSANLSKEITEIRLNYLGQFDTELNNDLFNYCDTSDIGIETDPENRMTAKLELNFLVINEQLRLDITFNTIAISEEQVTWFGNSLFNNLREILNHIENQSDLHYTPSDFSAADLSQNELDELFY